ncbi:hypothetical protein AS592_05030 [Sulfurovum riftiae]|uniref:SCP domain-containing protein n=2 Tax=Sulfurovum riftiae TaxID=1630136 RepID=A0A151CEK1_9BACT|nr:hypothetical protein AS592_05030 [Sulfurovum riftiae]
MLRSIAFFLCTLFLLEAGEKQSSAIAYLNTIRQKAGLIKLRPDTALRKAAQSHAKYLLIQQQYGHYEKKGRRGYTGKTPADRALYAGYLSRAVMENVSVNAKNYHQSIDTLFAAIYHRFVFLNFNRNEIGVGSAFGKKKKRRIVSAFVYLMGSSEISGLCKEYFELENGIFYMDDLCKDPAQMVPQYLYEAKREAVRRKNAPIVLHPSPHARDVLPVFYTEHPHPLPGSKVSGYPVSVQFNPAFYSSVKLKKFRLYDAGGREIRKVKLLTHNNDVNHRFTPLQFALMPLKRLDFAQTYRVAFEAVADGKRIEKSWKFTTKGFKEKLYTITKRKTTLKVKKGEKIVLFFKPKSNKDVLNCVNYTDKLHITCYDQNTLRVRVPANRYFSEYTLHAGNRRVILKMD